MVRDDMTVGEVVIMRRTMLGLSQKDLAGMTAVSTQTISRVERDESNWNPRPSTIAVLERSLEWPAGTFQRLRDREPGAVLRAITDGMETEPRPGSEVSEVMIEPIDAESPHKAWSRSTYEASQRLSGSSLAVLAGIVDVYVRGHGS